VVFTAKMNAAAIAMVPSPPTTRAGNARKPRPMTIVPSSGHSRMSHAVVCI
jgi:hypothetical protein